VARIGWIDSVGRRQGGGLKVSATLESRRVLVTVALSLLGSARGSEAQTLARPHGMTVEDLLSIEQVNRSVVTRDGHRLALEILTPGGTSSRDEGLPNAGVRSTVWLSVIAARTTKRIGSQITTSLFSPSWSPNGRALAMLGQSPEGVVGLYVYLVSKPTLHQVEYRSIDMSTIFSARGCDDLPVCWLSDSTILYAALDAGVVSEPSPFFTTVPVKIGTEWRRAAFGAVATASVLESGQTAPTLAHDSATLTIKSVRSGKAYSIGRIPVVRGQSRYVTLSANLKYALLMVPFDPAPHHLSTEIDEKDLMVPLHIGTTNTSGESHITWLRESTWVPTHTGLPPVTSASRVVVGVGNDSSVRDRSLIMIAPPDTVVRTVATGLSSFADLAWLGSRALLLRASRLQAADNTIRNLGENPSDTTSLGKTSSWYAMDPTTPTGISALPSVFSESPSQLFAEPGDSSLLAVSEHAVTRLSLRDSVRTPLLIAPQGTMLSVIQPSGRRTTYDDAQTLMIALHAADHVSFYRQHGAHLVLTATVKLNSGETARECGSAAEVDIVVLCFQRSSGVTAIVAYDLRSGADRTVLERNSQLSQITLSHRRLLRYALSDGDSSSALLATPPDYSLGRRLPLIAWVYAGANQVDTNQPYLGTANPIALNLEPLIAHGYAVLIPTIQSGRAAANISSVIDSAVLPAIQAAVDIGVADSARVGVMGQSFGGYTVYALISSTPRFRVAVALAGPSDLLSNYGAFSGVERYQRSGDELLATPWWAESGQGGMGVPPWRALNRYVANSPVARADSIRTPVLIVQGDLDYVPIEQGEEMYRALYRLNQRARFVRYWGEGHIIRSPANIRDMWQRIFEWLDEFLEVHR
jgi:dienelactone hydrolase